MAFTDVQRKGKELTQDSGSTKAVVGVQSSRRMVQPLLELGLSKYQAHVYLALVAEGMATAKNISHVTSIPYGKVYEVVDGLKQKGLVTITPSKPLQCNAVSPRDALVIISREKQEGFRRLEQQIMEEIEPLFEHARRFTQSRGAVITLHGRANVKNRVEAMIVRAAECINILASENGIKRLVIHKAALVAARGRGVGIVVRGTITDANREDVDTLSCCQWRNVRNVPCEFLSVDGKECLLVEAIPDDDNITYGRDLAVLMSTPGFVRFADRLAPAQRNHRMAPDASTPCRNLPESRR